ncbi:MAG: AAA family ATPase [Actinomycetota bacterium]|nr:AAA family ATPase [Actinomycetota bacterium]
MRIHHLEVTAFGPFSGSETVDFDSLTDSGLFLLCGPTGAGKTSILDAVCFGLYGEVPGDRNSAKRLRSDHAVPGVAPAVVLEMSISGRRFRVHRSPAWQRPKRRGKGITVEQARVSLEEAVAGEWIHLSNRLDETGHLITELLGMNVTRFCQVALLPQGKFQTFLRARSEERHEVLQQLFRTGRFEDIEKWLVSHRQRLKTIDQRHQAAVASVVSRVSEAAAAEIPEQWDLHELTLAADDGRVAAWADDLVHAAVIARTEAQAELVAALVEAEDARGRLEEAHRAQDLCAKHADATGVERSLAETDEEAAQARAALDSARRAVAVVPLLEVAGKAGAMARASRHDLGELLTQAARLLQADATALTPADLTVAERAAREKVTVARMLLPRERELESARMTVESTSAQLGELAAMATALGKRCQAIPIEISRLRDEMVEHSRLAAELGVVEQTEKQLRAQLAAAEKLVLLHRELEATRVRHRASVEAAHELREQMHDIREARITGMAAELAGALASGGSCPVCGSASHPSPATSVTGAPSKADEEAARSAYEDADFIRQNVAEALSGIERSCALARHVTDGNTVAVLHAELRAARERRSSCQQAAAEQARLEARLELLHLERTEVQLRLTEVGADTARLTQERSGAEKVADKVSAELADLLASEEVADSVERLIETKSRAGMAFTAAREALVARDAAMSRAEEAHQQARDCAVENGFLTSDDASSAMLSREAVESLEAGLTARERLRAQAVPVLTDPQVLAAVEAGTPDVAGVQAALSFAEDMANECGATSRLIAIRESRLEKLRAELRAELGAWAPTRSAYSVAVRVSTLAEGKGADNAVQMRLSAYVLGERLAQVVAAANQRLATMSDQRYALERSAARGVGELRGGLSLLVRDEWTGESRDPATLSGGETFVASLALALGLADVVTQEAGGSNIDTLFIDEGFGTLDPETLDDVMDTLDGLRDGGRVVGIVSHVPEMRTRVPAQLQIRKERSGSRVVASREAV